MVQWGHKTCVWARKTWKRCFRWAKLTGLGLVVSVAQTLEGILNAIALRATNGLAEEINSRIERIKRFAYGFRSREHFRRAGLFYLGGLDLYPASVVKPS